MSRAAAIARAHRYFDSGEFLVDLRRRVAIPSTSQEPERAGALRGYLEDEMVPTLAPLGFTSRILDNPSGPAFLVAERIEDEALLTVLIYGHGDTVRGLDDLWRSGLSPWVLTVEGPRIYGRGTADNKGQHSINIAALTAALAERGRSGAGLGFNTKILIEMGEEVGSAGLRELCMKHKQGLLHADLLIASDGPRIAPDRPTLFLGARAGLVIVAFDRRHAYELLKTPNVTVERETFESALNMGRKALLKLGLSERRAARAAAIFREQDDRFFKELAPVAGEEEAYVMAARDARETTERLLRAEMQRIAEEEDLEDAPQLEPAHRLEAEKERV